MTPRCGYVHTVTSRAFSFSFSRKNGGKYCQFTAEGRAANLICWQYHPFDRVTREVKTMKETNTILETVWNDACVHIIWGNFIIFHFLLTVKSIKNEQWKFCLCSTCFIENTLVYSGFFISSLVLEILWSKVAAFRHLGL